MLDDNLNTDEVAKFSALAATWWDPHGDSRTLHDINPCRLEFIATRSEIAGARILDVGCGGGLLTEALTSRGGLVTGIDAAAAVVAVARGHAEAAGLAIDYAETTAEAYAELHGAAFDTVVCMELIEHVPHPESLISACGRLLKPGGALFVSTLNRTPSAYLEAILGAEYLLNLLPIGTHDYSRFITPAELAEMFRANRLQVRDVRGMRYNPLTRRASLVTNPRVNYLAYARRD
ncbi:MAG: bifunctional 2-polyprenyl-6-hydroxyphenol methylase/3-demethylubiquinol 3-O-methyltransferase UbiG [Gammaproteobacteria bacterium]|nr:bifunctional 2-polyprenyl-6-hydroxyphenol methylase/3-demethylubiquinol 3-O-methyltransferase UbiG [Gammaproteobacteria bacterium]